MCVLASAHGHLEVRPQDRPSTVGRGQDRNQGKARLPFLQFLSVQHTSHVESEMTTQKYTFCDVIGDRCILTINYFYLLCDFVSHLPPPRVSWLHAVRGAFLLGELPSTHSRKSSVDHHHIPKW